LEKSVALAVGVTVDMTFLFGHPFMRGDKAKLWAKENGRKGSA
jgi:hypothetical protein